MKTDPDASASETTASQRSSPPAGSPARATIDLHRAMQFLRPILVAVQSDTKAAPWRASRATAALAACDTAMITADIDYPEFDFYGENTQPSGH